MSSPEGPIPKISIHEIDHVGPHADFSLPLLSEVSDKLQLKLSVSGGVVQLRKGRQVTI